MSFKGKLVKYFDGELDSVSVAHSITSLNFVTQKSQRGKKNLSVCLKLRKAWSLCLSIFLSSWDVKQKQQGVSSTEESQM